MPFFLQPLSCLLPQDMARDASNFVALTLALSLTCWLPWYQEMLLPNHEATGELTLPVIS